MICVIQRVSRASVTVDGRTVGAIESGLAILVGVEKGDGPQDVAYLTEKIANLRIFDNDAGKFDLSLIDVKGAALVISQFTLPGDWRKGRRPGYDRAAPPDEAKPLVKMFAENLEKMGVHAETGEFGAHMEVSLVNDGPVTFTLDTTHLK